MKEIKFLWHDLSYLKIVSNVQGQNDKLRPASIAKVFNIHIKVASGDQFSRFKMHI